MPQSSLPKINFNLKPSSCLAGVQPRFGSGYAVPSQRGESCSQNSANQADGKLLEIGLLAAIGHYQETADQHQNSNGCRG